jgi:hypothetical protein
MQQESCSSRVIIYFFTKLFKLFMVLPAIFKAMKMNSDTQGRKSLYPVKCSDYTAVIRRVRDV